MVKDTFAAKEVETDLQNEVCDDDFTIDVLVDPSSGEVVACVEYVYMRKYLWVVWVECVAVKQTYQKAGIGRLLIERFVIDYPLHSDFRP